MSNIWGSEKWLRIATIIACCGIGILVFYARSRSRILYLSAQVIEYGENSGDALKELGASNQERARLFVESVAIGKIGPLDPALQVEAISITGRRGEPVLLTELASLLRTDQNTDVRSAVADVLVAKGCPEGCIESVLRYLKAIFQDEENFEERNITPFGPEMLQLTRQANVPVYEKLRTVLKNNSTLTVVSLTLGEIGPDSISPFAIDLLKRVKLQGACEKLRNTNYHEIMVFQGCGD